MKSIVIGVDGTICAAPILPVIEKINSLYDPEHIQEMIDGAEPKSTLLKRLGRLNKNAKRKD